MDISFEDAMDGVVMVFEVVGVAILIIGSTVAFVAYLRQLSRGTPQLAAFTSLRSTLGRGILLGLEVLVVADIVRTIVVDTTLQSAVSLGIIVVVRILLSFAIDVEIDGVAPWRRRDRDARSEV